MSESANVQPGGLVEVSRSGGFAGMTMHGRVNLDRLSETDRAEWHSAFAEGFESGLSSPTSPPPAGPDRLVYRIRNRTSGLDVTVGEQDLPEHLRDLLDRAVRPPT